MARKQRHKKQIKRHISNEEIEKKLLFLNEWSDVSVLGGIDCISIKQKHNDFSLNNPLESRMQLEKIERQHNSSSINQDDIFFPDNMMYNIKPI